MWRVFEDGNLLQMSSVARLGRPVTPTAATTPTRRLLLCTTYMLLVLLRLVFVVRIFVHTTYRYKRINDIHYLFVYTLDAIYSSRESEMSSNGPRPAGVVIVYQIANATLHCWQRGSLPQTVNIELPLNMTTNSCLGISHVLKFCAISIHSSVWTILKFPNIKLKWLGLIFSLRYFLSRIMPISHVIVDQL